MGAVYEARHTGTGRRVAVKVIIGHHVKSGDVVARFQREARAAGGIETQHIAQVLDTGTDRTTGNPYMVMEYLQGEDVQQCIRRVGPLEPDTALRIVAQACVGLQKAHEAGVIHRDIKPANLYLAGQDHGAVVVKLLDFGIAKVKVDQTTSGVEDAGLTRTGSMLGSPLYMSPEQAKGAKSTDLRTDIWSLGVVLYEILAGKTPYSHCESLGELILEICSSSPRLVQDFSPWVPPEVAAVVHRALTMDVNRRYASVSDMLAEIRQLLPQGMALDQSALVPMLEVRRSAVAPKLSATATGLSASSSSLSSVAQSANGTATAGGSIVGGLASSQVGGGKSSKAVPLVLGGVLVAALGGFGVYKATSSAPAAAPTVTPDVVSSVVAVTPPAIAATAPAPERRAKVAIVPEGATVEVDGVAASVVDGSVTLTGTAGSVHPVRVSSGKSETTVNVVISEAGAIPARVELKLETAAAKTSKSAAKPAAPAAAAPVAAAPAAPAAPKPAAPAPPANVAVDRSFQ